MTQAPQGLTDYEQRHAQFAYVRALILNIVHHPRRVINDFLVPFQYQIVEGELTGGLTWTQYQQVIYFENGFIPKVRNRGRELRDMGMIVLRKEMDGLLHVYPVE